jgi:ribosome production factor 1
MREGLWFGLQPQHAYACLPCRTPIVPQNHARATSHRPELVLNNFDTRLGHRVGRMFASLFHQDPTFRGRRVVTFHNQRDFIFFRHHRYIFEERQKKEKGKKEKVNYVKARLQVSLGGRNTKGASWQVLC